MSYAKIALALILVGFGVTGVLTFRHLAAKAATAEARIEAAERAARESAAAAKQTQERLDQLSREVIRRAEFDRAIAETRARITTRLDKASDEDPAVRDYMRERIPDSVRRAYLDDAAAQSRR